jgi:hypothetical protein
MSTKQSNSDFPHGIGNPATRALEAAGYTRLKQLTNVSEAELLRLHGMGPKAVRILRETLEDKGWSFASISGVDAYMQELEHPFKAEVESLRKIIRGVDSDIIEQVKWNAPSYQYLGKYLVTFNLRETKRIHLVFHHPLIAQVDSPLLEGDYADRRMVYFADKQEIKAKKAELVRVIKQLVEMSS